MLGREALAGLKCKTPTPVLGREELRSAPRTRAIPVVGQEAAALQRKTWGNVEHGQGRGMPLWSMGDIVLGRVEMMLS